VAKAVAGVQTRMAAQVPHQAWAGLVMGQIVLAQRGLLKQPATADLAAVVVVENMLEVMADLAEAAEAPDKIVGLAALAEAEAEAPAWLAPVVREVLSLER